MIRHSRVLHFYEKASVLNCATRGFFSKKYTLASKKDVSHFVTRAVTCDITRGGSTLVSKGSVFHQNLKTKQTTSN